MSTLATSDEQWTSVRVFRAAIYAGTWFHFLPSLLAFGENYSRLAYRTTRFAPALHEAIGDGPTFPAALAVLLMVAATGLLAGTRMRRTAHVCLALGAWVLLAINSMATHTLAIQSLFGALTALILFDAPRAPADGYRHLRMAVVAFLAASVFCAGMEKWGSDWFVRNEMFAFVASPAGTVALPWVSRLATANPEAAWQVSKVLSAIAIVYQWCAPLLLIHPATRIYGLLLCLIFFGSIGAALQIPILFLFVYLPGLALAIRWDRPLHKLLLLRR